MLLAQIDGEKVEIVTDFIFLDSKITADGDCSHDSKRHLLLGKKKQKTQIFKSSYLGSKKQQQIEIQSWNEYIAFGSNSHTWNCL